MSNIDDYFEDESKEYELLEELKDKFRSLLKEDVVNEISKLKIKSDDLMNENSVLKKRNSHLTNENKILTNKLDEIKFENDKKVEKLKSDILSEIKTDLTKPLFRICYTHEKLADKVYKTEAEEIQVLETRNKTIYHVELLAVSELERIKIIDSKVVFCVQESHFEEYQIELIDSKFNFSDSESIYYSNNLLFDSKEVAEKYAEELNEKEKIQISRNVIPAHDFREENK